MRNIIENTMKRLRERVVAAVPEAGEFEKIFEEFVNQNPELVPDRYRLTVCMPPKGIKERNVERFLSFEADKDSSDTCVSVMVAFGSKRDIVQKLQSPELTDRLVNLVAELSHQLSDL